MKKLIASALLLLASCEIPEKHVEHKRCVVTRVTEKRRSDMNLPPEVRWVFETDCGATASAGAAIHAVGDTVDVQIISYK